MAFSERQCAMQLLIRITLHFHYSMMLIFYYYFIIIADIVSQEGKAIGSVRLTIRLFSLYFMNRLIFYEPAHL